MRTLDFGVIAMQLNGLIFLDTIALQIDQCCVRSNRWKIYKTASVEIGLQTTDIQDEIRGLEQLFDHIGRHGLPTLHQAGIWNESGRWLTPM